MYDLNGGKIYIGRQGENLARLIQINVAEMTAKWPEAQIVLLVERPGDAMPYPPEITVEDGVLTWPVTAADTSAVGLGRYEVQALENGVVAKSVLGVTECRKALGEPGEAPDPVQNWVDQVVGAAQRAEDAADQAEAAAVNPPVIGDNGNWYLWDFETGAYVDSGKPSQGSGSGGVTQETDPTVPAWAKEPTKPAYTAAEVGALPDSTDVPVIDATLTQSGQAADAKATGNRLDQLNEEKANQVTVDSLAAAVTQLDETVNVGKQDLSINAPFELPGYVNSSGEFSTDANAARTDYIPVNGYGKVQAYLTITSGGYRVAFFDADKQIIKDGSVLGGAASSDKVECDIPDTAVYVIFSYYTMSPSKQYGMLISHGEGLAAQTAQLVDTVRKYAYYGAAFGAFEKWGAVGDSLSVGHTQDSSGTNHARNIYYSWPQYMARTYGNTCLNFGQSGATAKSWMSASNCYDRLVTEANLCQAYVVGLGANDAENLEDYASGLGTAADINVEDSSGNADSFYGWYGKVISAIRTAAPQARIFLFTLPHPRNNNANVPEINTAIVEIANMFDNTALVDLSADYNDYFKDSRIAGMLVAGHFTAAGYANIAKINAMALSDVMNANPADYKDIPFIPFGEATELD